MTRKTYHVINYGRKTSAKHQFVHAIQSNTYVAFHDIFTLHQELLQSAFSIWSIPTYNAHTDFTYTLAGLYHVKSTLFIGSCIYVRSPQERSIDYPHVHPRQELNTDCRKHVSLLLICDTSKWESLLTTHEDVNA